MVTMLDEIYKDAEDIPYGVVFEVYTSRSDKYFSKGDRVWRREGCICNDSDSVGFILASEDPNDQDSPHWDYLSPDELREVGYTVEHLVTGKPGHTVSMEVYRPVLEERKVGKLQVHLVDQGFPNALLEVARVMTWAGEVKGYKPHDWKNLPDAENAFEGAASRHRMTHNVQRQGGMALADCVDDESRILHKAHEAFNVLAELELILTGKLR